MISGFTAYLTFTDLTDIFSILQIDFPTPALPKLGQVLFIYIKFPEITSRYYFNYLDFNSL